MAPGLLPALVGGDAYESWLARWRQQGGQRLASVLEVLTSADDVSSRLAEVSAPALVIHAEADPIIPLAAARGLNAALPGAGELVVVPGAGVHAPVLTHPDTVIPAIRKFLRQ